MNKNIKWLLVASLSLVACHKDDDSNSGASLVTPGTANFSKYVAIGDSFAAGYSDGALFKTAQQTAYPAILAGQLVAAGGGSFTTPFMSDDFGGLLFAGNTIQGVRLYWNGSSPAPVPGSPTTEVTNHLTGSFNNMGVPGAKSYHLVASGYGNTANVPAGTANPYYARFSSSSTATVLGDALAQSPSFFSLWIGGNDVLGYALSGGTGANHNLTGNVNPATYGGSDITNNAVFNNVYNTIVTQAASGGRKGVVANLPYVSTLPFFTTVGYNPIPLNATQAAQLNAGYANYNAGLVAAKNLGLITETERLARTINFQAGKNAAVIIDEYLTDITPVNAGLIKMRQTTVDDYILLLSQGVSVQAHLSAGNGTQFPLQDRWVLSKGEVAELKTATDAYNATILAAATANDLAFVDAKAIMNQLVSGGIQENGYTVTSAFVTGAGFSLDGVHPSPRGYALIANRFIQAINAKYGSTVQPVNIGTYRVLFPASL